MPTKMSVDRVLADTAQIINAWEANPDYSLGNLTLADLKGKHAALLAAKSAVDTKNTELTALLNQRDQLAGEASGLASRLRSGFRAFYGPDSSQYKQAGGTRVSGHTVEQVGVDQAPIEAARLAIAED